MQEIRQKIDELLALFKEKGLKPSISIWLHTTDNKLTLDEAIHMVREIGGQISAIDYDTPVSYACVKSELPFLETYAFVNNVQHKDVLKALIAQ
jgi:hypothetical protein